MAIDDSARSAFNGVHTLGPTMHGFLEVCWAEERQKVSVVLGSALICLAATFALWITHHARLSQAPASLRKSYYQRIVSFPAALCLLAVGALVCPSARIVCDAFHKMYEGWILYTFGFLLFLLLAQESKVHISREGLQSNGVVNDILTAVAAHGPRKHFGVPPFGCCFRTCMHARDLTAKDLSFMFGCVRQYVLVLLLLALTFTYLQCALKNSDLEALGKPVKYIHGFSALVCFYGLIILYLSTHDLLHSWKTTKKFVAIKLFLLALAYEEWLTDEILSKILRKHDSCFGHVGFIEDWNKVEAKWWSMWLIAMQGIPMILMLRAAFPVDELYASFDEVHADQLKIAVQTKGSMNYPVSEAREESAEMPYLDATEAPQNEQTWV